MEHLLDKSSTCLHSAKLQLQLCAVSSWLGQSKHMYSKQTHEITHFRSIAQDSNSFFTTAPKYNFYNQLWLSHLFLYN